MKKLLMIGLVAVSVNSYGFAIHNPDGSTSYGHQDANGIAIQNSDQSNTYITKDPSGATRIENSDGSTSYVDNNNKYGFE
jgi:hypothetical protein